MGAIVIAILAVSAVLILGFFLWSKFRGGWEVFHQRLIGFSIFIYGCYLATLTGTTTSFMIPGVGAIGGGAAVGGIAGLLTWVVIGTVGIATGGTGIALGKLGMVLIGMLLAAMGAAGGGFGFKTVTYPLVSPVFWGAILILGLYFCVGSFKKKKMSLGQNPPLLTE